MSISYDKKRNKYSARITLDGKRRFLGYRDTEREAERDYDQEKLWHESRKRMAEMMKNFTVENYSPPYEEHDDSFRWVETKKALRTLADRIRVNIIMALFTRRK